MFGSPFTFLGTSPITFALTLTNAFHKVALCHLRMDLKKIFRQEGPTKECCVLIVRLDFGNRGRNLRFDDVDATVVRFIPSRLIQPQIG